MQVFESSAGELSPSDFNEFCLPYLERIVREVKARLRTAQIPLVPMVIFARGAHHALEQLGSLGYDVVQIDWTIDPATARARVGPDVTLQVRVMEGGRGRLSCCYGLGMTVIAAL